MGLSVCIAMTAEPRCERLSHVLSMPTMHKLVGEHFQIYPLQPIQGGKTIEDFTGILTAHQRLGPKFRSISHEKFWNSKIEFHASFVLWKGHVGLISPWQISWKLEMPLEVELRSCFQEVCCLE